MCLLRAYSLLDKPFWQVERMSLNNAENMMADLLSFGGIREQTVEIKQINNEISCSGAYSPRTRIFKAHPSTFFTRFQNYASDRALSKHI